MEHLKIAITGASGKIARTLAFRIASGEVFGPSVRVQLNLLSRSPKNLEGLVMELEDCAYSALSKINVTDSLQSAFNGIDWAFFVGGAPREKGQTRKDLLYSNANIFAEQGRAIERYASSEVKALVVANPCNTNAWIAMQSAPSVPKERWFAMTRLDENRSRSMFASKLQCSPSDIKNMIVWGNHSLTQYPDAYNASLGNKPLVDLLTDESWLKNFWIPSVQNRGKRVLEIGGRSSVESAVQSVVDTVRSLTVPSEEYHSVGVNCNGTYGLDEDLIVSLPVRAKGNSYEIASNFKHNSFARAMIASSLEELKLEAQEAQSVLALHQ